MNKLLAVLLFLLSVNGYACIVTLHADLTTDSFLLGKITLKKLTHKITIDDVGTEEECQQRAKSYKNKPHKFKYVQKIDGSLSVNTRTLTTKNVTYSF